MGITKEQAGVAIRAATFLTNAEKGSMLGFTFSMKESDLVSVNAEDPPDVITGYLYSLYLKETKPSGRPLPLSLCLHYLLCIALLDCACTHTLTSFCSHTTIPIAHAHRPACPGCTHERQF